jgi:hypothetical protein
MSVVLLHTGSWWVPECCGFGSTRQKVSAEVSEIIGLLVLRVNTRPMDFLSFSRYSLDLEYLTVYALAHLLLSDCLHYAR